MCGSRLVRTNGSAGMLSFVARRILLMVPTVFAISIVVFVIIQLPPGDFLTTLEAAMSSQGEKVDQAQLDAIRNEYGLGQPVYVQYYKWMKNILLHGNFGRSFEYNRPVTALIGSRLAYTLVISIVSLMVTWLIAFPIGIYSA